MTQGLLARCERGDGSELRIVLGVPPGLAEDDVAAVVSGFERAISRSERVAECVDSVELTLRSLEEPTGHR